ncbi:MAG: FAD-binding oxidoreductase [Acidimicrobiales bacterium]
MATDRSATPTTGAVPAAAAYLVTERLTRTIRITELRVRPLGAPMAFRPGQYVLVGAPGDPELRAYSVANAPRPDGELTLLVTRVPGGRVSTWLHESAWPGQELAVAGPFGGFVADPDAGRPTLYLAAGAGLAPVLALVEEALAGGATHPMTVLFSVRARDEVFCEGTLAYWERRYPSFRFFPTFTQRAVPDELSGRIPVVLGELFDDLSDHTVHIAGPWPFVDACAAAARALGAPDTHVHVERYQHEGTHPDAGPVIDLRDPDRSGRRTPATARTTC